MEEKFKKYEEEIIKEHQFGWKPSYKEEFSTSLSEMAFIPIALEVIEKLDWDFVYQSGSTIEAKRGAEGFHWGQGITISYNSGRASVESKPLGSVNWDNGRNSKRVKLFIYAFKEIRKGYTNEELAEKEEETRKNIEWDDYEIPHRLPSPRPNRKSIIWIPILGGVALSIILGSIVAYFTIKVIYIIGLYEIIIGFLLGYGFKFLIRWGNYSDYSKLHYVLIAVVGGVFLSSEYFQYLLIAHENNLEQIGFWEFMSYRFQEGLIFRSTNTGSIGLVISWIIQLGLTYYIGQISLITQVTQYQVEKVPSEVMNFAYYHFVKGKNETEVRSELAKMGWSRFEDQEEVFESIGAMEGLNEMNRM